MRPSAARGHGEACRSRRRTTDRWPWLTAAALCLFAAVRTACVLGRPPLLVGDSHVYLVTAQHLYENGVFWADLRPPFVPLCYRLLGATDESGAVRIVVAQTTCAILAWSFLALAVASAMHGRVARAAAFTVVLAAGLTSRIAIWDRMVLSESVSTSLLVALIGSSILLLRRPTWQRLSATLCLAAFSCNARVLDTVPVGLLAAVCAVRAIRARDKRLAFAGCALLGLVAHAVYWNGASPRWRFPLYNVLLQRILVEDAYVAWFAARGMPLSPALLQMRGKWASSDDHALYQAADLLPFRDWATASLRSSFAWFLATHPAYAASGPLRDRQLLIHPFFDEEAGLPAARAVEKVLDPVPVAIGAALLLVASAGWNLVRRTGRWPWIPLGLLGGGVLTGFCAWHGDAMEVSRHALSASMLWNLGLLLAIPYFLGEAAGFASRRLQLKPAPDRAAGDARGDPPRAATPPV